MIEIESPRTSQTKQFHPSIDSFNDPDSCSSLWNGQSAGVHPHLLIGGIQPG
ncbi:hypothetical protein [Gordonia sp. X0973]|uniref:hypothetical protein n=1 Tax=Gordonia sp. X0973 TaxID=2742602 RepID=UPI002657327F|nr:hypothetical protein [Gordonia sp. X0973]